MNHSVRRLSLVCLLAVFFATLALGHHNPQLSSKATESRKLVADGPGPVPWPKSEHRMMVERPMIPVLRADGPGPVPWPKARGTVEPTLMADGPGPVPWPKAAGQTTPV
jgi:hypothetical protein